MLFELVLFFTIATALTTLAVIVDHVVRSRAWLGIPIGLVIMAAAAWLTGLIAHDPGASVVLPIIAIVATALVRALLRRWSMLAAQLLAMVLLASAAYLVYAGLLPFIDRLSPLGVAASLVLLLMELAALTLSVYYVFEILDVFSRRTRVAHVPDPSFRAKVAIQVPCYNEPIEVMRETLTALAKLRYPDVIVQVVDNNTKDEKAWRAMQQLCQVLGPRFQFIHLETWPGYKAGALNEATRRLPGDVSVLAIVDADYIVKPNFLEAMVGHFADPRVAFVQTPQNYRDWKDSGVPSWPLLQLSVFLRRDDALTGESQRHHLRRDDGLDSSRRSGEDRRLERAGDYGGCRGEPSNAGLRWDRRLRAHRLWRGADAADLRWFEKATIPLGARRDSNPAPSM